MLESEELMAMKSIALGHAHSMTRKRKKKKKIIGNAFSLPLKGGLSSTYQGEKRSFLKYLYVLHITIYMQKGAIWGRGKCCIHQRKLGFKATSLDSLLFSPQNMTFLH